MRVMGVLFAALLALALFGGCSGKQVNDTTNSIVDDVKNFGEKVTEQH
ncbi:MAG: hypothetical protein IE886_07020 [Campylobacterales bacterium]|nr:hypothetical protein [Campylobacterales bacterium]